MKGTQGARKGAIVFCNKLRDGCRKSDHSCRTVGYDVSKQHVLSFDCTPTMFTASMRKTGRERPACCGLRCRTANSHLKVRDLVGDERLELPTSSV